MPNFQVLQCFSQTCGAFQVQQEKKVNKWKCTTCAGEKQSVIRVYFESMAAIDCRKAVQELNMRRLTVADDINRLVLESTNMAEQAQKSQLQVTQERVDPNSEAVPRQASSIVNSLSIKTMGVIGASNSKSIWNAFVEVEEGDDDEGQTDESVVYSHPSERQIRRKGRFRGEVEMESTITSRAQKRAMSTIPDEIPHLNKKSAHQAVGASRYSITNFSQQRGAINSVGPKPAELSISLLQEERISKPAMPVCRKEAVRIRQSSKWNDFVDEEAGDDA